ncbi:MAG: PorV/PorQ family protein [Candidatus Eisenbacteria bacterium]|uniref:PorV/PorQ family protein n=1 Tax=Eiseniibacteriota bacterium TaxID=2212470 RepID=A0A849SS40_UNCEI|nr:PorV/PorQ family protein [Candidatus Eisenbacteria bacterium]
MRWLVKSLSVIVLLGIAGAAQAQGTGRSLDIQPGGRQNGMGGTGAALTEDATGASWWNPAGLGFISNSSIEWTFAQLVPTLATDVTYNYGSYVQPVGGWGAFGIGFVFLSYGESQRTDTSGNVTGTFGSHELSPAVSYGIRLLPDFAVGATLKYVRIQLAPDDLSGIGSTFGVDIASLYRLPVARLSLGVNIQNLGPSVTFINENKSDPLGRNVKVGAAWQALADKSYGLTLAADFNQSLVTDEFRTYNAGLEFKYADQIAGRLGYMSDPLGDISDVTYGLGLVFKGLALDWGSIPQARNSDLGTVQKLTLGYRF